jgi:Rps23 Pro-64 3,4-dihydroxylase Tpa1-like proline 4-hydroxylase
MKTGGLLGAHVDHSHSANDNKLLHVANAIFYVSQKWDEAWGGETLLFNSTGFKIIKKISPKPNRLILFIHSSTSFSF